MIEKDQAKQSGQNVDQPHTITRSLSRPVAQEIPAGREVKLYARIKRSSKYYHQGLDGNRKPRIFPVEEIRAGSHPIRLNNNNYRPQDLAFLVLGVDDGLIEL